MFKKLLVVLNVGIWASVAFQIHSLKADVSNTSEKPVEKISENLIKNGDFSRGKSNWKGDGRVEINKESKNKFISLKLIKKRRKKISQKFRVEKFNSWTIKLKIKAVDVDIIPIERRVYTGVVTLEIARDDGSIPSGWRPNIPLDGKWHDIAIKITNFHLREKDKSYKTKYLNFILVMHEGSGSIKIDDVSIVGSINNQSRNNKHRFYTIEKI